MSSMHKYLLLLWSAFGLPHARANQGFLLNDEGFPSTYLGSTRPLEDISDPWSTPDLFADTPLAAAFPGEYNNACLKGMSGFLGGKRIRSIVCPGDQSANSDPDLEEIIKDLEMPWNDDGSAIDDGLGVQSATICPDPLHLEHVLPVCSSGSPKDITYTPLTGEVKLDWCTLGMFSKLYKVPARHDINSKTVPVTQYNYMFCYKPRILYCCKNYFPMVSFSPASVCHLRTA